MKTQRKRTIVNVKGHRWYICKEKSSLGDDYVTLERVAWQSDLKRFGQVVRKIDVPLEAIVK